MEKKPAVFLTILKVFKIHIQMTKKNIIKYLDSKVNPFLDDVYK